MNNKTDVDKAGWASICFVAGMVIYGVVFYAAVPERRQSFLTVFVPDDVVLSWMGGDVSQFTILDRLPVLLVTGTILLLALALGWLTLSALGCDRDLARLEMFVFSMGTGLSELSLLTLTTGLAGGLRTVWPWLVPLLAVLGLGVWNWRRGVPTRARRDSRLSDDESRSTGDRLERHGLWLAVPFVFITLLGAMLPPWDFDVREYHLQVPKEWYQRGSIDFLPHNVYGNMPLGAEMHALLAMSMMPGSRDWWWGALAGKTVIACFAPLGALSLLAAGRRFASTRAGVVAALVYISLPWIVSVSVSGLIEGAAAFYTLLAVYAMLLWRTRQSAPSPSFNRLLGLAGFLAGSAAACKYPAILLLVFPLAVWTVIESRRARARACTVFLLAAICGCGLWLGKNWVLADNPIYPLVLGGRTRTEAQIAQWNRAHRVPVDGRGQRYSAAQLGQAVAQFCWKSTWQSPLLVPLAVMAFVGRARRRLAVILTLYAGFYLAGWWLMTHRLDRFWVPLLPVLCLLAGIGADWSPSRLWRGLTAGVLLAGLAANLLLVLASNQHDWRYLVSLDRLRLDEPIQPDGPSRVHPAHRYLNDHVRAGHCALLVGDAQPFDVEVPVLYNTCFDACIFEQLMRGRTREERFAALHDRRISHVVVNWSEIDRYRSPGNYGFTDYVTRRLVRDELVREQGVLRPVKLAIDPERAEVFEVLHFHTAGPSPAE